MTPAIRLIIAGASALAVPLVSLAADPGNGGRIYNMHCVACHGVSGHAVMPNAPSFARGERLMQPDPMIANAIRTGKNAMPSFLGILREQDIRDVVAYLRTLNR